jgi:hypothetical protein
MGPSYSPSRVLDERDAGPPRTRLHPNQILRHGWFSTTRQTCETSSGSSRKRASTAASTSDSLSRTSASAEMKSAPGLVDTWGYGPVTTRTSMACFWGDQVESAQSGANVRRLQQRNAFRVAGHREDVHGTERARDPLRPPALMRRNELVTCDDAVLDARGRRRLVAGDCESKRAQSEPSRRRADERKRPQRARGCPPCKEPVRADG